MSKQQFEWLTQTRIESRRGEKGFGRREVTISDGITVTEDNELDLLAAMLRRRTDVAYDNGNGHGDDVYVGDRKDLAVEHLLSALISLLHDSGHPEYVVKPHCLVECFDSPA